MCIGWLVAWHSGRTSFLWHSGRTSFLWHSGRTSFFNRRTFPVLCSTCSWPMTTYVDKPSSVGQPTRLTHNQADSSLWGRWMSSRLQLDVRNLSLGRHHLVNAYEVKAGIGVIAGNTVWSMPECLACTTKRALYEYTYIYLYLFFLLLLALCPLNYHQVLKNVWPSVNDLRRILSLSFARLGDFDLDLWPVDIRVARRLSMSWEHMQQIWTFYDFPFMSYRVGRDRRTDTTGCNTMPLL